MSSAVDWEEVSDRAWTPKFVQARSGLLTTFTGPCPRCRHAMTFEVAWALPPSGGGTKRAAEDFTMLCCCGIRHTGAPEGDYSCGAYWPYEAEF